MTEPTTASLAALYEALAKAQGAMSPAPKDGTTAFSMPGTRALPASLAPRVQHSPPTVWSVSQSPCFDAERNMVEVETTLAHARLGRGSGRTCSFCPS